MRFLTILFLLLVLFGCTAKENNQEGEHMVNIQKNEKEKGVRAEKSVIIGEWKTEILNKEEHRVHNIALAVSKLNGYTIAPQETFSFNALLGERTAEKGYKEADIFVGEATKKAVGGGICQVSGTLYMAVKQAGLSVTERHAHSRAVAYAAEGEDACVNYGSMDFRFVNTTQNAIEILAATDGASVTVQIVESK